MLPRMIRGLKKAETVKRVTEILAYLGLGDRIKHRPAELSGGEQQCLCPNISRKPWRTGIS
jgi:lipoprotein-releasing system ATP-binding protein